MHSVTLTAKYWLEPLYLPSLKDPPCLAPATFSFSLSYYRMTAEQPLIHGFAPRAKLQLRRSLNSGLGKNFRVPSLIFAHAFETLMTFLFITLFIFFLEMQQLNTKETLRRWRATYFTWQYIRKFTTFLWFVFLPSHIPTWVILL